MELNRKRWLVILPLTALLLLILVTIIKPEPTLKAEGTLAPLVNTQIVRTESIQPFVTGFGRARPKQEWQAVSEVSGSVIYRHENLEQGKAIPADTVILKIDPTDYELKLAQANSDVRSAEAELARIELNESKLELSLELEKQQLSILSTELERKKGLLKNGSVSKSEVDIEQRNVLAQEQKVLDLENALKQHPSDLAVALAKLQLAESKQVEAQRKLGKTQLVMPFDARIAEIDAELEQVVKEGQMLVLAHKLDVMEIPVQVPMVEMRHFSQYAGISAPNEQSIPDIKKANITANVVLHIGSEQFTWPGTLTSVGESIDSQGNTVTMIVDVDVSGQFMQAGKHPPLINDMYVEVNILGKPTLLPVIPIDAVHGDKVYILSSQNTLQIQPVQLAFESNGRVAITEGLKDGTRVITSDVIPPVKGMALRTVEQGQ